MKKDIVSLRFEEDDDRSGCGTLIIALNKFDFFFVPVTHTEQIDRVKHIVGDYSKLKPCS